MTAYSPGLAEELEAEMHAELLLFGEGCKARIRRMLVEEGHCKPGSPLLDEVFFEVDADGGITVGIGSEIAVFLEWGTAPHIIRSRDGRSLSNGSQFFGPEVQHPGTEPAYIVMRAVLAENDAWERR